MRRVFDNNQILLDDKISLKNKKSANEDTFFSHFQLFAPDDE